VATLRAWLLERSGDPSHPLFPTRSGRPLNRDAIELRLAKYVSVAAQSCPSLKSKRISAHVLRHTTAMQLLHAGVDTSVIALWLGYETTQIYLHADISLKERALTLTKPPTTKPGRFRPSDSLVHFMRNAVATVPKFTQQMVAATLRTVFSQPDQASSTETIERICRVFANRYPQLVKVVQEAEVDVLAYYGFPVEHCRQIWSTNSLERLNKEVSRRSTWSAFFPTAHPCCAWSVRCSRSRTMSGRWDVATSALNR
jgi:hypothetical protein